jgi:hypothetical protein
MGIVSSGLKVRSALEGWPVCCAPEREVAEEDPTGRYKGKCCDTVGESEVVGECAEDKRSRVV